MRRLPDRTATAIDVMERASRDAVGGMARTRATARRSPEGALSAEVVVLTRDCRPELELLLAPLREAALAAGAELLFVDRGSTDGTQEYVAARAPGARGIWLDRDDPPREALAAAAAASPEEVLVLVEPTAKLPAPAITRLLDRLRSDPELDGVALPVRGALAMRRARVLELLAQGGAGFGLTDLQRHAHTLEDSPAAPWESSNGHSLASRPDGTQAFRAGHPVVLHVVECVSAGTERHVLDLIRHTSGLDHVLAIPSEHRGRSTAEAASLAKSLGARVEHVEMGRSGAPQRHVRALADLRLLIQRLRPDIVHGHSSIGGAMARLATIGLSVPVVYTPHALSRSRWALAAERLLASRADRLIAVSESERAFMLAHRLAEERKIAVIPNGIELRPPPPLQTPLRDRLGIGAQTMLIGCVGRLTWQKAPEVFVSACSIMADRLPDAHFVLIGSGPLQSLVEKAIRVTGIENRFHLLPALPGAAAALPELDVYVLPSRFEGGPYTPMEAMRAGTAVVVTGVAGNRDLVEHWVSGLVVPPDEPYALATAVLTVLNDAGLRERLVSGARQSVKRFAVHSMAESTASLYRELSGRRSDSLAAG